MEHLDSGHLRGNMDLDKFYDVLRDAPNVNLTMGNVPEFDFFLDYGASNGIALDFLAYSLATVYWETAGTMKPVREAYWLSEDWRKRNLRYYPYYGRGYVQLTWEFNYKKATEYFRKVLKIDVDFVKNPDLVMNKQYSIIIMFVGSKEGWFTGKKFDDYIDGIDESDDEDLREYKAARRVINGTDKALTIGKLALAFEKALRAGKYVPMKDILPIPQPGTTTQPVVDDPGVDTPEDKETPEEAPVSILQAILKLLAKLFGDKNVH